VTLSVRRWADNLERAHQPLRHSHHRARIIELSAVIGGRENSHQLAVGLELIPVLHHLMSATHQVQAVSHEEV
jgi:hypothetical protein